MAKEITPRPTEEIPPQVWAMIQQLLLGVSTDEKLDLREPHPKKSLEGFASYIIFAYGVLVVYGVLSNILLLIHVLQYRLNKEATYAFILNNAISDIIKCVFVLPISLYVLLVQNWMLGELLCTFLPMIQDAPHHVTMLTYVFLAWDRCRYLRNPGIQRLPAFVCAFGTWLTSICLVLPYPIYIIHLDLGDYFSTPEFKGVSVCIFNLANNMKEYLRGIFLITFVGPLALILYLFMTGSREITRHSARAVVFYETRRRASRVRTDSYSTTQTTLADIRSNRECDKNSDCGTEACRDQENVRTRYEVRESELNIEKEKRTHKYLLSMIIIYAVCLLPLMILRLARLFVVETYKNGYIFDYTFVVFVWMAFLPTCITPALFAFWQMNNNRKLRNSSETVVTSADTPSSRTKFCRGSLIELNERCAEGAGGTQQYNRSS